MSTISHTIIRSLPLPNNKFLKRAQNHRIRASKMDQQPMKGFPYLPPSHKELMIELTSSIESALGPSLLPSQVPPDVLYFENSQGTSHGALDIRSGSQNSTIDFILSSWLHCKLPTGDLNITTIFAFLNASTDAPHLLMEFIQGTPTSLILFIDLLPRKDAVLHPEYLDEYYNNEVLDKLRENLEKTPQVSPYRSSSLYIRSVLSPTAVAVSVNCGSEGVGCLEEVVGNCVSRTSKEVVELWMSECVTKVKEIEEEEKEGLLRRDGLIKKKTVEIDLAANLPRLFGNDVAGRVVGEIQKAFRIK